MSSKTVDSAKTRVALEKERVHRQGKQVTSGLTPIKAYLVAYNVLSATLWGYLLVLVLWFIATPRGTDPASSSTLFTRWLGLGSSGALPAPVYQAIEQLKGSYDFHGLGCLTKWTQTLAVMEVVHSLLGWVRSPVGTTAAQVASRLWTVWGVVEMSPETHTNPFFTTMLFAWSLTEVVRYSFYVTSLLGIDIPVLNYLRYTTFIPLYPLGAGSEALLSLSTLPPLSTLPILGDSFFALKPLASIIDSLPRSVRKALLSSTFGRALMWHMAKAGAAGKRAVKGGGEWGWMEYVKLVLFCGWPPALYVLYTHMLKQRKKFFAKGKTVGGANKAQ
ncbi:3-hydroxyacyl-CoA dehydratase [Saitozyma sp. JCM 24511]|nr:3-hydroxyacyl-CoA dehydratase [Saitozyma sp. JCM 24511]